MFDEKELLDEMKVNIQMDEQLRWGRTIGGSTLLFWFQQSEKARIAATMAPVQVAKALALFQEFVQKIGSKTQLWANGQDFDLGILGNLYDTFQIKRPWEYNAGRDMRTLIDVFGKPDIKFEGEQHDALADARHQAQIIQTLLKKAKK